MLKYWLREDTGYKSITRGRILQTMWQTCSSRATAKQSWRHLAQKADGNKISCSRKYKGSSTDGADMSTCCRRAAGCSFLRGCSGPTVDSIAPTVGLVSLPSSVTDPSETSRRQRAPTTPSQLAGGLKEQRKQPRFKEALPEPSLLLSSSVPRTTHTDQPATLEGHGEVWLRCHGSSHATASGSWGWLHTTTGPTGTRQWVWGPHLRNGMTNRAFISRNLLYFCLEDSVGSGHTYCSSTTCFHTSALWWHSVPVWGMAHMGPSLHHSNTLQSKTYMLLK